MMQLSPANSNGYHHYTSGPDFDNVTVSSSRPATGGNNLNKAAGVRKVQSSAFVCSSGKDAKLQANKLRINQNSGQLHAPKMTNHGAMGSKQNSFHLSKEAYQKLTQNYNYAGLNQGNTAAHQRKNQIAYATQDLRMQSDIIQQKYGKCQFSCLCSILLLNFQVSK